MRYESDQGPHRPKKTPCQITGAPSPCARHPATAMHLGLPASTPCRRPPVSAAAPLPSPADPAKASRGQPPHGSAEASNGLPPMRSRLGEREANSGKRPAAAVPIPARASPAGPQAAARREGGRGSPAATRLDLPQVAREGGGVFFIT